MTTTWRRSTRCETAACVEVAQPAGAVLMRDSKDVDGPILTIRRAAWTALIGAIRAGQLGGEGGTHG